MFISSIELLATMTQNLAQEIFFLYNKNFLFNKIYIYIYIYINIYIYIYIIITSQGLLKGVERHRNSFGHCNKKCTENGKLGNEIKINSTFKFFFFQWHYFGL